MSTLFGNPHLEMAQAEGAGMNGHARIVATCETCELRLAVCAVRLGLAMLSRWNQQHRGHMITYIRKDAHK